MSASTIRLENWRLLRPVRRHYLWRYESETPPRVRVFLQDKTIDLNETASLIWEQIDGHRLVQHIVDSLAATHARAAEAEIARQTVQFLSFCNEEGLIYMHWEPLR